MITEKVEYTNPVFADYQDVHPGASAILFGCGPTLKEWQEREYPGVLRVGVNELIFTPIALDYYFVGDNQINHRPQTFGNNKAAYYAYEPRLAKFVRKQTWGSRGEMPRDFTNALYYWCDMSRNLVRDIVSQPLACCASISFEAFQFMLYTGIKRIYFVGHDCNYTRGTFRTASANDAFHLQCGSDIITDWEMVANEWLPANYPEVEIFSIRPVALKVFPEVTQDEIY